MRGMVVSLGVRMPSSRSWLFVCVSLWRSGRLGVVARECRVGLPGSGADVCAF